MKRLQRRSCLRWYTTTMPLVQRTNGLFKRTETLSLGSCQFFFFIRRNFFVISFIYNRCESDIHTLGCLFNSFRPRILIDVSKIDMTTTILGFKISMPIMVAPTAMQKMAHPEGKTFCRRKIT